MNLAQRIYNLGEKYTPFIAGALILYATPTSRVLKEQNRKKLEGYKTPGIDCSYYQATFYSKRYQLGLLTSALSPTILSYLFDSHFFPPTNTRELRNFFTFLGILYITNAFSFYYERKRQDSIDFQEFEKRMEEITRNSKK